VDILVLSTWFPYPADNGSRIRAFNLIRELVRQGHRVRLIAGQQNDIQDAMPTALTELVEEFIGVPWQWHRVQNTIGSSVRAMLSPVPRSILETPNPVLVETIHTALKKKTDVVLVMELGMDAYLPELPNGTIAVMEQAEVSGIERAYQQAKNVRQRLRVGMTYTKSVQHWRKRFQRYAAITAVSTEEAAAIHRVLDNAKNTVAVIPNGVDIASYTMRSKSSIVPGRLIYNGSLTYRPNYEAVRFFAQEILPIVAQQIPNVHLVVTGRYTDEHKAEFANNSQIVLTGFLDDIQPTLATAAVCVVPLQSGGGTRLKILEAWAVGLPVVSTTVGANGLEAQNGVHCRIQDEPKHFAEAVIELLQNPEQAHELACAARRHAEQKFDWSVIGKNLSDFLITMREKARVEN
jgi:polysaccharide biosynthesis protein PslH